MADDTHRLLERLLHEVVDGRRVLEQRIGSVESKLDSFRNEALGHFDTIYRRLGTLESEYHAAIVRLEQSFRLPSLFADHG